MKNILFGLFAAFAIAFLFPSASMGATTLSPGDIAIIGYNYDAYPTGQQMAIVVLVPIESGTVIYIADYAYDENTSAFATGSTGSVLEGCIKWTTTSAIAAGTVFNFSISTGGPATVSGLPGTIETSGWTSGSATSTPFPAGGDNLFIFQGSGYTSPSTFVFAFTNPWATTYNSVNQPAGQFLVTGSGTPNNLNSYLPASLTLGTNAIALNRDVASGGYHGDNNVYNGTKTGTKAAILSAICNPANWITNETTTYDLTVGGSYFAGGNPVFTITSPNSAPTDISLTASSVNEKVTGNTTVGTLSTTDPDDGNTFTYTLVEGTGDTDNASFNISESSLRITNTPDYETKNSYSVRVRTTDQGGLTFEKEFTISINNLNDAPVITSNGSGATASVNASENSTSVTTVTATDQDASTTLMYIITGGVDQNKFLINTSTGVLTFASAPNFESPTDAGGNNVYDVQVTVSDGPLTDVQNIAVTVLNVNEAPSNC